MIGKKKNLDIIYYKKLVLEIYSMKGMYCQGAGGTPKLTFFEESFCVPGV